MDTEFDSDDDFHQPTTLEEDEFNQGSEDETQSLEEEAEHADEEVIFFKL